MKPRYDRSAGVFVSEDLPTPGYWTRVHYRKLRRTVSLLRELSEAAILFADFDETDQYAERSHKDINKALRSLLDAESQFRISDMLYRGRKKKAGT